MILKLLNIDFSMPPVIRMSYAVVDYFFDKIGVILLYFFREKCLLLCNIPVLFISNLSFGISRSSFLI